jgi:hypothetical protein
VSPETWDITDEDSLARGEEEEQVGELGNMTHHRGLTDWRGGRKSGLVSLETWYVTEDSPTRGEEEGGAGWEAQKRSKSQTTAQQLEGTREERVRELRNVTRHKQGLTNWRGGRGRGALGSLNERIYGTS